VKPKVGERAYELELPPQMNIHPVFYVELLERYRKSTDPTHKQERPLLDEVNDQPSYGVEQIVHSGYYGPSMAKLPKRFVVDMVFWAGYGPEENSWKPYDV
jgi:hypothetical protein